MTGFTLGRTDLFVNKTAFGALPIQRVSADYAAMLLRKAYDAGINFYDTARSYSDSEEKIGRALADVRGNIIIATKTPSVDAAGFWRDLETSLSLLKTDYIDIYQFHNPPFCPRPGDGSGLYEAMQQAREQGKIRFIGITEHRMDIAREAVLSGLYDTLQFPFSYLADDREIELYNLCVRQQVGFIVMKALCGGLITNAAAACAWLNQYDRALPIWGVQRETELDELIGYMTTPPALTSELTAVIERDREELLGNFCRACGYCMPDCPAGIHISQCARMSQLIRRSPSAQWLSDKGRAMMGNIDNCTGCGVCRTKCPYGLDTPALLKANLADYNDILLGRITV